MQTITHKLKETAGWQMGGQVVEGAALLLPWQKYSRRHTAAIAYD